MTTTIATGRPKTAHGVRNGPTPVSTPANSRTNSFQTVSSASRTNSTTSQMALPVCGAGETRKPYARELLIAELAVQRAAVATKTVLRSLNLAEGSSSITGPIGQYLHKTTPATATAAAAGGSQPRLSHAKLDKTPVTVADYAAQALLISALHNAFPHDAFIGEEDAAALRADRVLAERVWALVAGTALLRADDSDPDGAGNEAEALLLGPPPASLEHMLDLIDLGGRRGAGGRDELTAGGRCWTMDPVDGTSAFLQGGQYAVSLALIEGGREKVGVLGCPNLRFRPPSPAAAAAGYSEAYTVTEDAVDREGMGLMLSAVQGQGATVRPMGRGGLAPALVVDRRRFGPAPALRDLHFVDSAQSPATWTHKVRQMAELTGARYPGTNIYSSHVRYAAMALGGRENVQIRVPQLLPSYKGAFWSIWDHAGSQLIYTESGPGRVTDIAGNPIRFDAGHKLTASWGVITADETVYDDIFSLVTQMQDEDKEADVVLAMEAAAAKAKKTGTAGSAAAAVRGSTPRRTNSGANL